MDNHPKKRRGPITIFAEWFMVDPVMTGIVMAPLVLFVCLMAYLAIRMAIADRF